MKQELIGCQSLHTVNCSISSGQKNRRPGSQKQFSVSNIEEVYGMLIATVFEADENELSRQDIMAWLVIRTLYVNRAILNRITCHWSATSDYDPVSAWCVRICRSRPPREPANSGYVGADQCCIGKYRGGYCCSNRCELLPRHMRRTARIYSQWHLRMCRRARMWNPDEQQMPSTCLLTFTL